MADSDGRSSCLAAAFARPLGCRVRRRRRWFWDRQIFRRPSARSASCVGFAGTGCRPYGRRARRPPPDRDVAADAQSWRRTRRPDRELDVRAEEGSLLALDETPRRLTFGAHAEEYDLARPDWPVEVARWFVPEDA